MPTRVGELIEPGRIRCRATVTSKKAALECLAQLLAGEGGEAIAADIFDALVSRERLGSTGLGQGVALPHARLHGISSAVGAFVSLEEPIEFDAADRQPVDLLFGLTVPEQATDEHLEILASLAEMLRTSDTCSRLRAAMSPLAVRDILLGE